MGNRWGRFVGSLIIEVSNGNGRDVVVYQDFRYIDPDGRQWIACKGEVVNGASVPRLFWRLMPPFTGKYRRASVIHDAYCRARSRGSREVHLMFYRAMRCDGVGSFQAGLMWLAVRIFGPRFRGGSWK